MIIVYITCASSDEASKIGRELVENKLAACIVTYPVRSMYWWKGKIEESAEHVLIAKSTEALYDRLKKKVRSIHSYETPCIIRIDCRANDDYEKWVHSICG